MPQLSLTPFELSVGRIALAAALAAIGFYFLLPRPSGRRIGPGIAVLIAAAAVFAAWLVGAFGRPMPDLVGTTLFGLFATAAVGFGAVLVTQRNPARGAIAFAFVILSTCGLFLLLAATLLMAATIIVYAGAIIVTFLFALMLSQTAGPADENDRSREPLLGSLAGFGFTGLVLLTLYLNHLAAMPVGEATAPAEARQPVRLPVAVLTSGERQALSEAVSRLDALIGRLGVESLPPDAIEPLVSDAEAVRDKIAVVVGSDEFSRPGSIRERLEKLGTRPGEPSVTLVRSDEQARRVLSRTETVRRLNQQAQDALQNHLLEGKPDRVSVAARFRELRDETLLLAGMADLPARNVSNLGYLLYTQHLLAVELAGILLLIATIGAIAITHRKGVTS